MAIKILIIDDDVELCEEIKEPLEDEGYSVTTEHNGLKAKRLIENYDYDILLLDIRLPGLTGLEILKGIKDKGMKPKVLIITGRPLKKILPEGADAVEDEEEATLKLADGIINKPFDGMAVLNKIKELIGKSQ